MSRFFDVTSAIREAFRVLKPGGLPLISVANGYLDVDDEVREYVIPGLKDVNGSEFVSPDRPFDLLSRYHRMLRGIGLRPFTCRLNYAISTLRLGAQQLVFPYP